MKAKPRKKEASMIKLHR